MNKIFTILLPFIFFQLFVTGQSNGIVVSPGLYVVSITTPMTSFSEKIIIK